MSKSVSGYALAALLLLAAPATGQTAQGASESRASDAAVAPTPPWLYSPAKPPRRAATSPGRERAGSAQQSTPLTQGIANYELGNYEEAFDDLTKAWKEDEQSAVAAYYLGMTLKKMQRIEDSLSPLLAAVTLKPPEKQALLELADAYYVLGRLDEALQALKAADKEWLDQGETAFLRGLVLAKEQMYPEALSAFETARSSDRKLAAAATFQIASIYLRVGNLVEACDLFREVENKDPESELGQMAKQQADVLTVRIETRYAFTAAVNAQEQYDSNVVLKPDDASAAANISNASDLVSVLAVRAEVSPLQLPYGLKFRYNGYLNAHQKLKMYDIQSHSIGAVSSDQLGAITASLPITYTYTLLENTKYLQSFDLAPTYSFAIGENQSVVGTFRFQKKDYLNPPVAPEENRDATNLGVGISWFHLVAQQQGFASLTYELDKEDAAGANWSYVGHKVGAGLLIPVADTAKFSLGIEAYRQGFGNTNTTFLIRRTDTSYMGSAQFLYPVTQTIDAQAQYVAMKTSSTIPVYGYSKNTISLGLVARF